MTDQDYLHIRTVTENKEIFASIEEAMRHAAGEKLRSLRQKVREGNTLGAARIESAMEMLEEVPRMLERYAGEYRTTSN